MSPGGDGTTMSPHGRETGHPVDALVDYARGAAADAEGIERHLAGCETCRVELEIVRALAAAAPAPLTDIERRTAYRSFEARRTAVPRGRTPWLGATWRVAAGIVVLLTSAGVWRAVDGGSPVTEWNPDAALEGFVEDLADLDVSDREVSAVLGVGLLDDPAGPWVALEGGGSDAGIPWEEER